MLLLCDSSHVGQHRANKFAPLLLPVIIAFMAKHNIVKKSSSASILTSGVENEDSGGQLATENAYVTRLAHLAAFELILVGAVAELKFRCRLVVSAVRFELINRLHW